MHSNNNNSTTIMDTLDLDRFYSWKSFSDYDTDEEMNMDMDAPQVRIPSISSDESMFRSVPSDKSMNNKPAYVHVHLRTRSPSVFSDDEDSSLVNQQMSLFIPHVFKNITVERITKVFESLAFGSVKRVDLVTHGSYNRVYVHFNYWVESSTMVRFQEKLKNKQQVRVVYDDPYYWVVLENTSPHKLDSPSSGLRFPKIRIQLDPTISYAYKACPRSPSYSSACEDEDDHTDHEGHDFMNRELDAQEEFVHRDYAEALERENQELREEVKRLSRCICNNAGGVKFI